MIETLIDKQDNFEIIRDEIAAILVTEIANQQILATAVSVIIGDGDPLIQDGGEIAQDGGLITGLKDPDDWKLNIYIERANPWEQFLNNQDDQSPIVNIWYDSSSFDPSSSNVVERQKTEGVFNIDCYGYGMSEDVPAGGHKPGDKEAALQVQKALRLVRNILMAAEYTYLGLRGLVWGRWPQAITVFQPQIDGRTIQQIVGARLAFRVTFNETSPQVVAETLELLSVDVKRTEDGLVVLEADYDYT